MRMRPLPRRAHVAAHLLDQVDRARDVRVYHVPHIVEVLIEEALAEPVAGIGQERVHRPSPSGGVELVDALECRKVGLDRLGLDAERAELLRRLGDLRLVSSNEQIEAVLGADLGEFVADAGRSAGHDGKGSGG